MDRKSISSLVIVVFFGLLLEAGLIALDCSHTPSDTAVSYARAYFMLDPAMTDLSCDTSPADNYLHKAVTDAEDRGFSKKFARYALSHVETWTEYLDNTSAVVHLTGHRRLAVNPLYAYVAGIFRMGKTYDVEESFQVRLEDGTWKVCESSLPLL